LLLGAAFVALALVVGAWPQVARAQAGGDSPPLLGEADLRAVSLPGGVAPSAAVELGPALGSDELEAYWAGFESPTAPTGGEGSGGQIVLVPGDSVVEQGAAVVDTDVIEPGEARTMGVASPVVCEPGVFGTPVSYTVSARLSIDAALTAGDVSFDLLMWDPSTAGASMPIARVAVNHHSWSHTWSFDVETAFAHPARSEVDDATALPDLDVSMTIDGAAGTVTARIAAADDPSVVYHAPGPVAADLDHPAMAFMAQIAGPPDTTDPVPAVPSRAAGTWSRLLLVPTVRVSLTRLGAPPLTWSTAPGGARTYTALFDAGGLLPGDGVVVAPDVWSWPFPVDAAALAEAAAGTGGYAFSLDGERALNAALVELGGARSTVYTAMTVEQFTGWLQTVLVDSGASADATLAAWVPHAFVPGGCGQDYVPADFLQPPPPECVTDGECDDGKPCTIDRCDALGLCDHLEDRESEGCAPPRLDPAQAFRFAVGANGTVKLKNRVLLDAYDSSRGSYQDQLTGVDPVLGRPYASAESVVGGGSRVRVLNKAVVMGTVLVPQAGQVDVGDRALVSAGVQSDGPIVAFGRVEAPRLPLAPSALNNDAVPSAYLKPSGALKLTGGASYTLPAGTYRFRRILLRNHAVLRLEAGTLIHVDERVSMDGHARLEVGAETSPPAGGVSQGVELVARGVFRVKNRAAVEVEDGGHLALYVGKFMAKGHATLDAARPGALNVWVFGDKAIFRGERFVGTLYVPRGTANLSGGGDLFGAVGATYGVTAQGQISIHQDLALPLTTLEDWLPKIAIGQPAPPAWPMARHDLAQTARADAPGPKEPVLAWMWPPEPEAASYAYVSPPVIDGPGNVYFSRDGQVHSVNRFGEHRWGVQLAFGTTCATPALSTAGDQLYVLVKETQGSPEQEPRSYLFALRSEDGVVSWFTDLRRGSSFLPPLVVGPSSSTNAVPTFMSPTKPEDVGVLVVVDDELFSLAPNGSPDWRESVADANVGSLAGIQPGEEASEDDGVTLVVGAAREPHGPVEGAPAIVRGLDALGHERWTIELGGYEPPWVSIDTSAANGPAGRGIYAGVGSDQGLVFASTIAGSLTWAQTLGGPVQEAPVLGPQPGQVLVTAVGSSSDSWPQPTVMSGLDAAGSVLWQSLHGSAGPDPKAIVDSKGFIYAACFSATLSGYEPRLCSWLPSGEEDALRWSIPVPEPALPSIGISHAGTAMFTTTRGRVGSVWGSHGKPDPGPWPMGHCNAKNTGRTHVHGPGLGSEVSVDWSAQLSGTVWTEATVRSDGTIVVVSDDGVVQTWSGDGQTGWTFDIGVANVAFQSNSATLADDGKVFVADQSGTLFAIGAAGNELWPPVDAGTGGFSGSPLLSDMGLIVVQGAQGAAGVWADSGTIVWKASTEEMFGPPPYAGVYVADHGTGALEPDDYVVFGSQELGRGVTWVDVGNGNLAGNTLTGWRTFHSPVVLADGSVVVVVGLGGKPTDLVRVTRNEPGVLWQVHREDGLWLEQPVLVGGGRVVALARPGNSIEHSHLVCFDVHGAEAPQWDLDLGPTGGTGVTNPVADVWGRVYLLGPVSSQSSLLSTKTFDGAFGTLIGESVFGNISASYARLSLDDGRLVLVSHSSGLFVLAGSP